MCHKCATAASLLSVQRLTLQKEPPEIQRSDVGLPLEPPIRRLRAPAVAWWPALAVNHVIQGRKNDLLHRHHAIALNQEVQQVMWCLRGISPATRYLA